MISILSILSILGLIFTLMSFIIGLSLIKRLGGKFKSSFTWLLVVVIILLVRGLLRLANVIDQSMLDKVNLFMNFIITLFILIAMINFKQMIKAVDRKKLS